MLPNESKARKPTNDTSSNFSYLNTPPATTKNNSASYPRDFQIDPHLETPSSPSSISSAPWKSSKNPNEPHPDNNTKTLITSDPIPKGTTTPLHTSLYYRIYEISQHLCKKLTEYASMFKHFFREPEFYGSHSHLLYAMATQCRSQQRYITIHKDVYNEEIVTELADLCKLDPSELSIDDLASFYRDVVSCRLPDEVKYFEIIELLNKQNKKMYKSSGNNSKSDAKKEPKYKTKTYSELMKICSKSVFICFDLEWHERDQRKILEVGWCVWSGQDVPLLTNHPPGELCSKQKYEPLYVDPTISTRHYIVREFLGIVNHLYVEDMKFNFLYGNSRVATIPEIKAAFEGEWKTLESMYKVCFVGHGVSQDIAQLAHLNIHIPPTACIFDTSSLQKTIFGGSRELNLRDMVKQFGRYPEFLHNAGNDSYYTMLCFREFTRYVPSQHLYPSTPEDRYKHYTSRRITIDSESEKEEKIAIFKD